VKQITVIIVFLTIIFTCHDRTFQLVKEVPGSKPLLKATSAVAMSTATVLVHNGYLNHRPVNSPSVQLRLSPGNTIIIAVSVTICKAEASKTGQ
jgi:hypothetical protein